MQSMASKLKCTPTHLPIFLRGAPWGSACNARLRSGPDAAALAFGARPHPATETTRPHTPNPPPREPPTTQEHLLSAEPREPHSGFSASPEPPQAVRPCAPCSRAMFPEGGANLHGHGLSGQRQVRREIFQGVGCRGEQTKREAEKITCLF